MGASGVKLYGDDLAAKDALSVGSRFWSWWMILLVIATLGIVSGFDLSSGEFLLWMKGHKKPTVREAISEANFFPGFMLLTLLSTKPEPPPAGRQHREVPPAGGAKM